MLKRLLPFLLSCFVGILVLLPPIAEAKCSNEQIRQYDSKGMTSDEISDKCDMSVRKVERILENDDTDGGGVGGGVGGVAGGGVTPPQVGYTCCDGYGISRCGLNQPNPLGASCFCLGLGAGITCR